MSAPFIDTTPHTPEAILDFWFVQTAPRQWWTRSAAFDQVIRSRFARLHDAAAVGGLVTWRESAAGRLAEIIVLDQFSRNIYRDQPQAFACDPLALSLAQAAVAAGADRELDLVRRPFLYMPYMHSEVATVHELAVSLFSAPGLEESLRSELQHQQIILRFGRYPHRNAALDRRSTPEEILFLQTPGSSF